MPRHTIGFLSTIIGQSISFCLFVALHRVGRILNYTMEKSVNIVKINRLNLLIVYTISSTQVCINKW